MKHLLRGGGVGLASSILADSAWEAFFAAALLWLAIIAGDEDW